MTNYHNQARCGELHALASKAIDETMKRATIAILVSAGAATVSVLALVTALFT